MVWIWIRRIWHLGFGCPQDQVEVFMWESWGKTIRTILCDCGKVTRIALDMEERKP